MPIRYRARRGGLRAVTALLMLLVQPVHRLSAAIQSLPLPHRVDAEAGRLMEQSRRVASRTAGVIATESSPREIRESEYAGRLPMPPAAAERLLREHGFRRNLFARLKTRDGEPEYGSWVDRASPGARRQLHLMLFPGADDTTEVYAHEEFSSIHPLVAADHYSGVTQSAEKGCRMARDCLPLT